MALESEGGGGAKRRRVDDPAAGSEVDPVDRMSALPDDVRRRILTRLPLKDAIRSAALAQGWRDLWKSRWAEPTSCRDIHILPGDNLRKALGSLESGPRHRLDRFSFVSDNEKLRQQHLKRFLAYAAECRVEDLHVEVRRRLFFHLPLSSPLLAHLSLRNVDLCHMYYNGAQPFYALESMHLHSVNSSVKFGKVMALCPGLHTLDMRRCSLGRITYGGYACTPLPLNLRRMTVVECCYGAGVDCWRRVMPAPSLCSFRYIGSFVGLLFFLPKDAALITDLYICLSDREPIHQSYNLFFETAFPGDLSGLSVLTISSNALKIASSMLRERAKMNHLSSFRELQLPMLRERAKMNHLSSFRELQLLMLGVEMDNLANICSFFRACWLCHCPNLERLFVKLPATSDVPLEDLVEEVRVELLEDSLVKLRTVKVMNFNWRRFEVQLVSVLLRKATSLHKVLLVSPNVLPLHVPGVQDADIFRLKEALASGRIIVSEFDDPATQPFHSEVFINV